jgi:flagellar L-ring protein precursor FlgH
MSLPPTAGRPRALIAMMLLTPALLGGCSALDRLSSIGEAPDLSPIENPVEQRGYRPVSMPMPAHEPEIFQSNSLWRQGARSFFKDQRARTVGDVLKVEVTIQDEASLENESNRSRSNTEDLGVGGLLGFENRLDRILPGEVDENSLVYLSSALSNQGRGSVNRTEDIDLNVAAVVIQVLPNGNLVISGRQEVRVNFEVRELYVAGVVRPEDISPDNSVSHDQIAELRVAYGGRGQISDVQQPRYGSQVLDVILPF